MVVYGIYDVQTKRVDLVYDLYTNLTHDLPPYIAHPVRTQGCSICAPPQARAVDYRSAGEAQWLRTASACARAAAAAAASRCSSAARAAASCSAASASVACQIAKRTQATPLSDHAPQKHVYIPQLPVRISPSPQCHDCLASTQSCPVRLPSS
jgi:hypothetical protein